MIPTETINQYDTVKLLEDLNPRVRKGVIGTIVEKYNDNDFEVEFLNKEGVNINFENQFTFTVNRSQVLKVV